MRLSPAQQMLLREDVFRWLDEKLLKKMRNPAGYEFTRKELQTYMFENVDIPLLDTGRGIRNPRQLDATLTVVTSVKENTGYEDEVIGGGIFKYSLQGTKGVPGIYTGDNKKLRTAYETGVPIVYFKTLRPGILEAHYPVYVRHWSDEEWAVYLEPDEEIRLFADPLIEPERDNREYVERIVRTRRHQAAFRASVMGAYAQTCSVCELTQYSLVDAAHIIPDSQEHGVAEVTNGLALCKLHHSAYDRNILGISPDFEVNIREDILARTGESKSLQVNFVELHQKMIKVPRLETLQPDRDRLKQRFDVFLS